MAKNKQSTSEPTPATNDGSRPLVIQGLTFSYSARYAEGHPLTQVEANALNQLMGENLRNNFASQIKKAVDAQPKDEAGNPVPLSPDQIAKLQSDFAAYAASYEFSAARGPRSVVDPVEREARKMAKTILLNQLKAKGIDVKSLAEGKLDELIDALLEKQPAIRERAKQYVDSLAELANTQIGDLAA